MPTNPRPAGDLEAALDESFGADAPAAVRIAQHESNGETRNIAGPMQAGPMQAGPMQAQAVSFIDRAYAELDPGHFSELERLTHAAGELYGDALADRLRRELVLLAEHLTDAREHLAYARRERACDLDDLARRAQTEANLRTLLDHHRTLLEAADRLAELAGSAFAHGALAAAAQAYQAARITA